MINIFDRPEAKWNKTDDSEMKAWSAGWAHAYFGLDAGWLRDETRDMYELGKRDGARERLAVIERTGEDPYSW